MLRALRTSVRRVMERTGLIGPYYRMVERRGARGAFQALGGGRPVPPPGPAPAVAGRGGGWVRARRPPLDVADGSVDLIYGQSVLTHLTRATTLAWLAEVRRVMRPGGLAMLTFMDDRYAERWGPPDVLPKLRAEG